METKTPKLKQISLETCPVCGQNLDNLEGIPDSELPNMVCSDVFWVGYEWTCVCGATGIAFACTQFSHHGLVKVKGKEVCDRFGEEV